MSLQVIIDFRGQLCLHTRPENHATASKNKEKKTPKLKKPKTKLS
jgi:hypothetical protein